MNTATLTDIHSSVNENSVCLINLGRKHNFNVLPVEKIKETEKAIQFGSVHTPRHTIWFPKKALKECKEVPGVFWFPKKALKECKEVPGVFTLAPWFSFDSWGCLFLSSNMRIAFSTKDF